MSTGSIDAIVYWSIQQGIHFGSRILGAIVLWLVGRRAITLASKLVTKSGSFRTLDATVASYAEQAISACLNAALILAMLGVFGVETTSLAALLGAVGVAIGVAWAGLLAHFAAGVFLVILRPFKVGDVITVAGMTGTVSRIATFTTTLQTAPLVETIIGNNKIFGDIIVNHSSNPVRRLDFTFTVPAGHDLQAAMATLRRRVTSVPGVLDEPPTDVFVHEAQASGAVVLGVRAFCPTPEIDVVQPRIHEAFAAEYRARAT